MTGYHSAFFCNQEPSHISVIIYNQYVLIDSHFVQHFWIYYYI